MLVCPDCRNVAPCTCGWTQKEHGSFTDWLSTKDRSGAITSYMETYDLLAEHIGDQPIARGSGENRLGGGDGHGLRSRNASTAALNTLSPTAGM